MFSASSTEPASRRRSGHRPKLGFDRSLQHGDVQYEARIDAEDCHHRRAGGREREDQRHCRLHQQFVQRHFGQFCGRLEATNLAIWCRNLFFSIFVFSKIGSYFSPPNSI